MTSRRNFLLGGISVFALRLSDAEAGLRLHGSVAAPARAGQKAQVNLAINITDAYGEDFPFIDVARQMDCWIYFGTTTQDIYSLLNSNGYPTAMPTGAVGGNNWRSQTKCYMVTGDPWVLTWTGTADVEAQILGASVVSNTINSNRIEYTISGVSDFTTLGMQIHIYSITSTPGSIKFFRKSEETLLNSGQITSPHFISFYSQYGRMRAMDWGQTNGSMLSAWAQRPLATDYSWLGYRLDTSIYGGLCTQSGNSYTAPNAVSGNPSSWVNGQALQATVPAAPTLKSVTGMTFGTTTTVQVPSHGYSTGNVVFFPNVANRTPFNPGTIQQNLNTNNGASLIGPAYTITVVDANHFSLNGVNSTGWSTYVAGGVVGLQITFAAGSLPAKRIVDQTFENPYDSVTDNMAQGPALLVYDADFDILIYALSYVGNGTPLGIPIEVFMQVAHECGVNPWFCIPHMATDDFVTQWATLLKSQLTTYSTLQAQLELSNEVWGATLGRTGFPQTNYAQAKGALYWSLGVNENALGQWYGWRYYNVMGLIGTVFSGSMNRINRQFAVWTADNNLTEATERFEAPNTGVAAFPATRVDEIATAPYYEIDRATQPMASTIYNYKQGVATSNPTLIASAFSDLDTAFNASGTPWFNLYTLHNTVWPFWFGRASHYGVKVSQYEGGWGIGPAGNNGGTNAASQGGTPAPLTYNPGTGNVSLSATDQFNLLAAYQVSSNYAVVLASALADFKSFGGVFASQFTPTGGAPNANSMFEMVFPNIFGTAPPAKTSFDAYNAS